MKLRLTVLSSRLGRSNPDTGGFSGLKIGTFCPNAGAGGVPWEVSCAAAHMLMLKSTSPHRIICNFAMLASRTALLRHYNRVARLQYVVVVHLLTFDQFAIVHRQFLLFP